MHNQQNSENGSDETPIFSTKTARMNQVVSTQNTQV